MSDEGYRKNFWEQRAARQRGDEEYTEEEYESAKKRVHKLNDDRKALLRIMMETQDWIDANDQVSDPYTFAYCAQAGWIERRRKGGQLQFRITDEGIAVLHPFG